MHICFIIYLLVKSGVFMKYENGVMKDINIAYIGGGSRGWAWGLMSDLVSASDISGTVTLYDVDYSASKVNEIIGNKFNSAKGAKSEWIYKTALTLQQAVTGADFIIISILPGTFDEMQVDVHTPEEYGIYQSVGDTVGLGGIIRSLRCMPMFEEIGLAIKNYAPNAWVINYTNPMALCTKTLYRVFPQIKAFGCCHEVFAVKKFLLKAFNEIKGQKVDETNHRLVKANVVGVNHFTWFTSARYQNYDLFETYRAFAEKYKDVGVKEPADTNWMNRMFISREKVKFDLFLKYGYIAAAGDRHLAEFCPGEWYLDSPKKVEDWGFQITTVDFRKQDLKRKLERSKRLVLGEEEPIIVLTGEEGVDQIRALVGLQDLVTNVNIPNKGQISNLPLGAVVETNAVFRADELRPVISGEVPSEIYSLVYRAVCEQIGVDEAVKERSLDKAFKVFLESNQLKIDKTKAKELFDKMIKGTKKYLKDYK